MGRLQSASWVCRTRHRVSGVADEWLPILPRQGDRTRLTGRLVALSSRCLAGRLRLNDGTGQKTEVRAVEICQIRQDPVDFGGIQSEPASDGRRILLHRDLRDHATTIGCVIQACRIGFREVAVETTTLNAASGNEVVSAPAVIRPIPIVDLCPSKV